MESGVHETSRLHARPHHPPSSQSCCPLGYPAISARDEQKIRDEEKKKKKKPEREWRLLLPEHGGGGIVSMRDQRIIAITAVSNGNCSKEEASRMIRLMLEQVGLRHGPNNVRRGRARARGDAVPSIARSCVRVPRDTIAA